MLLSAAEVFLAIKIGEFDTSDLEEWVFWNRSEAAEAMVEFLNLYNGNKNDEEAKN